MGRLEGKYALITGGTSGIGLETARQFALEGATVAITGRKAEGLEAAARELPESVLKIQSDSGDVTAQEQLAQALREQWPRLDALYINAGDVTHSPLQDFSEEAYDRLMAINLKGPFFLIKALLPLLPNPSSYADRPAHISAYRKAVPMLPARRGFCRSQGPFPASLSIAAFV